MARLPAFLTKISPIGETLAAIEHGEALLRKKTAKRNDQLAVSTATDGLSLWEADYGLTSGGDMAARRARILTALAGGQTLTPAALAALAVSVGGADGGEVTEKFADWRVTLTARYEGRLPEDISPLEAAVKRLKPAHLEVTVAPVCRVQADTGRYLAATGGVFLHLTGTAGEDANQTVTAK